MKMKQFTGKGSCVLVRKCSYLSVARPASFCRVEESLWNEEKPNKYRLSINNTTLDFIYNKNNVLSGRHVSTFIRSSSGPLCDGLSRLSHTLQHIQTYAFYYHISQSVSIWDPTVHWNIDNSWIYFPRESEDDLTKGRNMSPWQYTIFIVFTPGTVFCVNLCSISVSHLLHRVASF